MDAARLPRARLEPPVVRAIARERVDRLLDRAWEVPLTIVVGPAGAGKSTAAGHLVERSASRPASTTIWYRAHPVDGDVQVLRDHLAAAVAHRTGVPCQWHDLGDLTVHFERVAPGQSVLVVIDEFDSVIGTDAERALADCLADFQPELHLMTLSRRRPGLNLSRLRVGDAVCEIGPDDLRFRSWEVDRLFRELYVRPLSHAEVAELERRTGGWVAALHLFDLATARLTPAERRAAIAHVGRRSGPDWDFLAENVLSGLSDELRQFLLEIVPLERFTAELCDELRGARDSAHRLDELLGLQLATVSPEAAGTIRIHEVLRAHVDALLREREDVEEVHKRYRRAGEVLERHGYVAEALVAYCRGEDWESVARLLGARGAEVAAQPGTWLLGVPSPLLEADPWLMLAVARQQRADGRVADALATFDRVAASSLSAAPAQLARRERLLLASFLDRSSRPTVAWVAALRDAVHGDHATAAALAAVTANDLLAIGLSRLLAGDVRGAAEPLRSARNRADASPTTVVAAEIALLVAGFLGGWAAPSDLASVDHAAAAIEVPFLSRLARAAVGLVTGSRAALDQVAAECSRVGDAAGRAVVDVLAALHEAWQGRPAASIETRLRVASVGLLPLTLWLDTLVALTSPSTGATPAVPTRRRVPRPLQDLAALGTLAARGRGEPQAVADRLRDEHGIVVPLREPPAPPPTRYHVRCFGRFTVELGGAPVDLSGLRARARELLRLLAANSGRGVHRDVIVELLWPGDDETSGGRKVHVAVSAIRSALDHLGGEPVVVRDGDAYLLAPERVTCDVEEFSAAVAAGRRALAAGRSDAAIEAFERALALHRDVLLPEDGAADWVVPRRDQLRDELTSAAHALAGLLIAAGRAGDAVAACRQALRIDGYNDPVWRALLDALQAAGDHAGHAKAVQDYERVLEELGVARR